MASTGTVRSLMSSIASVLMRQTPDPSSLCSQDFECFLIRLVTNKFHWTIVIVLHKGNFEHRMSCLEHRSLLYYAFSRFYGKISLKYSSFLFYTFQHDSLCLIHKLPLS